MDDTFEFGYGCAFCGKTLTENFRILKTYPPDCVCKYQNCCDECYVAREMERGFWSIFREMND